jgi:hypothetical protein
MKQPNYSMQPTGASPFAHLQFGGWWRLAPAADAGRSALPPGPTLDLGLWTSPDDNLIAHCPCAGAVLGCTYEQS